MEPWCCCSLGLFSSSWQPYRSWERAAGSPCWNTPPLRLCRSWENTRIHISLQASLHHFISVHSGDFPCSTFAVLFSWHHVYFQTAFCYACALTLTVTWGHVQGFSCQKSVKSFWKVDRLSRRLLILSLVVRLLIAQWLAWKRNMAPQKHEVVVLQHVCDAVPLFIMSFESHSILPAPSSSN